MVCPHHRLLLLRKHLTLYRYLVPSAKGDNAVVPNVAARMNPCHYCPALWSNFLSDVPVEFVDHKDGTYDVVFVPEVAGKYDVSVGLAADDTPGEEEGPIVHFEHSPFVTEINPTTGMNLHPPSLHFAYAILLEVSPDHSTVSHDPTVLPNGDNVFRVTLKDKDGAKIPFSGVPILANVFAKRPHGKGLPFLELLLRTTISHSCFR